jgi:hypothetical protein
MGEKAFYCSGVKASFLKDAQKKLFQVTRNQGQSQYQKDKKRIAYASDYVLAYELLKVS